MIRRSFLKRMAMAAAACALIDVPWPKQRRWQDGSPNVVTIDALDVYVSDFGTLVVLPDETEADVKARALRMFMDDSWPMPIVEAAIGARA